MAHSGKPCSLLLLAWAAVACSADPVETASAPTGGTPGTGGGTGGISVSNAGAPGVLVVPSAGAPSNGGAGPTGGTGTPMMCHVDCFRDYDYCRDGALYHVPYGTACECGQCSLSVCSVGYFVRDCLFGCDAEGVACAPDPAGQGGQGGVGAGGNPP